MPDVTTTETTTQDETATAPAEAAPTSGGGADEAAKGPRVSRARAKTVPARPEPDALPSAASAFASKRGATASVADGTGAPVMETPAAIDGPSAAGASSDAEIVRGAIGRLDARSVAVTQGAVGAGRAESISLEMSAIGVAAAGDATINRSIARAVLAGEVHLEQSAAQTVIAQQVTLTSGSMALVVFARRVEGEVRPLLDWRGGLALGAALGVVLAILRPGRRRR